MSPRGSSGGSGGRQPFELSGSESLAAVATGERSVSEIVGGLLERVRQLDGEIGAFRICDADAVQRLAKDLDDTVAGPLWGLAVGVKDVIDTADLPTGYGSPLFADHRPSEDARAVATLRRAGAMVLGKTESTEFAMYQPTRTRNPVDPARTPGGSSSGSAAAVAAGMVPVALGTQTAGSVVRPAAYCGVYGYKPAWGWSSTEGIWRLSERLDTLGMFARTVADLELLHRALVHESHGGPSRPTSQRRPTSLPRRAAVLSAGSWGDVDHDVLEALDRVAGRLEDGGWRVSELAMPHTWHRLPEHHQIVMAVEVAKNLHGTLGPRVELISEGARRIVEQGDALPARQYLAALEATEEARNHLVPLAEATDVVLAPSALGVAPLGLDATGDPVMCRAWTLLGVPAANVPFHRRSDGLPVGVQAIAPHYDDPAFLGDLSSLETALSQEAIGQEAISQEDSP